MKTLKHPKQWFFLWLLGSILAAISCTTLASHKSLQINLKNAVRKWQSNLHVQALSVSIYDVKSDRMYTEETVRSMMEYAHHSFHPNLFNFGSISKQFVIATTLQMQEQNQIKIEDTIDQFIRQHHSHSLKNLPQSWMNISIKQLMTMTSGIPNYWVNKSYRAFLKSPKSRLTHLSDIDIINRFTTPCLLFKPGSKWQYSDTNTLILGKMVEIVTHHSLATELSRRFKSSDQLRNTFFSYRKIVNSNPLIHLPLGQAARYLVSTTADIAHWEADLFSKQYLNRHSYKLLTDPLSKITGKPSHNKKLVRYSMALDKMMTSACDDIWYYPGNTPGFTTLVIWLPKPQMSISFASNKNLATGTVLRILLQFAQSNLCRPINK